MAKIDIRNTHIHDRSLSWLGTDTSMKNGRIKVVLWTPNSLLVKWKAMIQVLSIPEANWVSRRWYEELGVLNFNLYTYYIYFHDAEIDFLYLF
jgi:hypothetical protein